MDIEKPTPQITERFLATLPQGVTARRMFGCHAAFLNGNMVGGTWGDSVMLRLSPDHRALAQGLGARAFDPLGNRPMKDYLLLPAPMVEGEGLQLWLSRAVSFTSMMVAKLPKPRKVKPKVAKK